MGTYIREAYHMSGEHLLEKGDLLFHVREVDELLDGMRASLVLANAQKFLGNTFQNNHTLLLRDAFDQFLTEIVAITIHHHLRKLWQNLFQDEFDCLRVRIIQNLL